MASKEKQKSKVNSLLGVICLYGSCLKLPVAPHVPDKIIEVNKRIFVPGLAVNSMKRTKSEAEETRNRLLEAGLEVFIEKGFDRASLEEIAQRVGMTRGAVYWHFKDKLSLFEELITQRMSPVQAQLEALLAEKETPPLQKITSFVKMLLQLLAEDEAFRSAQQLLRKSGASVPDYSAHFSLWQDKYLLALEELFWQAQSDRAVMAHVSPRYLATYALSLVNGISQHLLDTDVAPAERKRMADRMVFMFMRSLQ